MDAIFEMQEMGGKASPEQVKELQQARKVFEELRPYGSHDAEAAYKKYPDLAREAASGKNLDRAIRALQFETEIRINPDRLADRFVERWQKLDQTSQRQYQAGDMSGYRATRSAMGDMARGLERDPQMESILANRKIESSASPSKQAAGSASNSPLPTASTSAEAGADREFEPSDFAAVSTPQYDDDVQKRSCARCNACPVWYQQQSETASRRQRGHARTRPYHPS